MNEKKELQEALYRFPYHYLPKADDNGCFSRHQSLRWGFAYLCYLFHIASFIEQQKPASLLDIGCGDGRLISLLNELTGCTLTGIDTSERAVNMARALNPGQRFLCGDAVGLAETFSLVSCIEVLEHIADHESGPFIDGVLAKVEPGGQLLIGVPSLNKPMSAKHFRHYDENRLIGQLGAQNHGFRVESCQYVFKGNDHLYRLYVRLTDNRFWFIGIRVFEKLMWRYVWKNLRQADASNGHHLLMCLRKTG